MMSDIQFDVRLQHIEEQYAARRDSADAFRDQEMARLFVECRWTQEKIAGRMGRKQVWVSQRLCFGRFLSFIATGDKQSLDGLTERHFRTCWSRTKGKEPERFAAVLTMLAEPLPPGYRNLINKPGTRRAILEECGDGRWYTTSQIIAAVEEKLPDVTREQVQDAIRLLRTRPPAGVVLDAKHKGKVYQYRVVKTDTRAVDAKVLRVYEQVKPLIGELEEWAGMSEFRQSPSALKVIAFKLKRIFDDLFVGEKV